jgi:hypothetical protein
LQGCFLQYISAAKREEFSPTYSDLPPREIFVEATDSAENRGVVVIEEADDLIHFPTSPRVEDQKAKVFTFEGLTPVSTADDAREDVGVDSAILEKESGVHLDETFRECSPLTADQSHGKDQNIDDDDMYTDSAQIISVSSSVKEKVAAWERHVASMRSSDTYDVPFDEEPIHRIVVKSDGCETLAARAISIPLTTTERIEEEVPMEDSSDNSKPNELVVETANLQNDSIVRENGQANGTLEHKAKSPHPFPAVAHLSLLDQEEEPEIHTAPSDEMESLPCILLADSDPTKQDATTSTVQMTGMESYGCPDELCNQVSKLWK